VAQRHVPVTVNMHPASTLRTDTISVEKIQRPVEGEHFSAGIGKMRCCIGIVKAFQSGRNA
jgi:hypothetical protein